MKDTIFTDLTFKLYSEEHFRKKIAIYACFHDLRGFKNRKVCYTLTHF